MNFRKVFKPPSPEDLADQKRFEFFLEEMDRLHQAMSEGVGVQVLPGVLSDLSDLGEHWADWASGVVPIELSQEKEMFNNEIHRFCLKIGQKGYPLWSVELLEYLTLWLCRHVAPANIEFTRYTHYQPQQI
ncbi:MAG: hypothetical protein A2516_02010 [Alphaproteobacteria bacterium RIFOXYD12_FULL_60_8]|nr:MAG: hypothetical protein A2516_02010 [Alphaproteobacteria bacterium RIFOXYD12_FULL_60_8]